MKNLVFCVQGSGYNKCNITRLGHSNYIYYKLLWSAASKLKESPSKEACFKALPSASGFLDLVAVSTDILRSL